MYKIENGLYELEDISFMKKFFPLVFTYIKIEPAFVFLLFLIPLALIIYICVMQINLMNILSHLIKIILIILLILFAMSRLLIIKNEKKQYMKICGNIVNLISYDKKNIQSYNLSRNYIKNYIINTGDMVTIILESHSSSVIFSRGSVKFAITFPKKCLENPIKNQDIINVIKEKEYEISKKFLDEYI